jgi:hypothetical protein
MSRRRGLRDDLLTDATCECGRPTRDEAWVCEDCLNVLAESLRSLLPGRDTRRGRVAQFQAWCPFPAVVVAEETPGLWETLLSVVAGESGVDYRKVGGSSGGAKSTGLDLNERAARTARALEVSLRQLVVECMAARVAHTAPARPVPATGTARSRVRMVTDMAAWLLWRIDGMAWHPEVAPLVHAVNKAVEDAVWVVDRPPTRQQLGGCPVDGCHGTLSATPGATWARCSERDCGHRTEAQPLRDAVLVRLGSSLVTAAEFADLAVYLRDYADWTRARDTIRKRVNQWAARHRVVPATGDGETARFRFNELYALEAAHHDRGRTTREVS